MTLDASYLEYPRRRRGMDHDHYQWSNMHTRPALPFPAGVKVAIWPVINAEYFPMVPSDEPFRAPGHMQTAYPDYRHYTAREYGSRIGIYRLFSAFEAVGAAVSVAMNSVLAERYPGLVEAVTGGGHEIIAHSTDMNGTIASGLPEDEERALITDSLDSLEKTTGTRPRGWHSIARSQSFNTPRLLVEAGISYMCDWANDELPYRFDTAAGSLINMPLNHELSDRQIINVQQHGVDSYAEQIRDTYDWLAAEAEGTGAPRMLPINLTPYIMGLPYRIDAFEGLIQSLNDQPGSAFMTGGAIYDRVKDAL